jgi:hypothetical protein
MAHQSYRIRLHDGQVIEGTSNARGETSLVMSMHVQIAEVEFLRADGSLMSLVRPMLARTTDSRLVSRGARPNE